MAAAGQAPAPAAGGPTADLNAAWRRAVRARGCQRYIPGSSRSIGSSARCDLQAQVAIATPGPPGSHRRYKPTEADNPAYVAFRRKSRRPAMASPRRWINKLAQPANYQQDLTLAPKVEKEYRELIRDYDNARMKYAELRSKRSRPTPRRISRPIAKASASP